MRQPAAQTKGKQTAAPILKSGPELPLRVQIAIGIFSCALVFWALPDLTEWIKGHMPPPVQTSAPESAEDLAARYAAALAACFNGGTITDGTQVVECHRR